VGFGVGGGVGAGVGGAVTVIVTIVVFDGPRMLPRIRYLNVSWPE
jgi:hypothetical protein